MTDEAPDFDLDLDPKACWALRHPEFFPVEVNRASYHALLRVPGIGVTSARRICAARRQAFLSYDTLRRLGIGLKRAQYYLQGKILWSDDGPGPHPPAAPGPAVSPDGL